MKLYVFIVAPNPTRVRLVLAEKRARGAKIDLPEVFVNLREGEQREASHLTRNPRGKLPVLELDDGQFLTESAAIIEYLEECFPEPTLLGKTPRERARNRELDRLADAGVLLSIARTVHATNSPLGLPPIPEVAQAAIRDLPEILDILDDVLSDGRRFLGGDHPVVADCTLQAAFQFARFAKLEVTLPRHIARWDEHYRDREPASSVLVV